MTNINNNMTGVKDLSDKVAFDANSLNKLKHSARESSPEAIKEVAKQFEAIFMNMMLKSMRAASPQDNPFDNEQSRTFTAMLDQQLSTNLAKKGLGLADVLARQLSKHSYQPINSLEQAVTNNLENIETHTELNNALISNPLSSTITNILNQKTQITEVTSNLSVSELKPLNDESSVTAFQKRMLSHAKAASIDTGVPAHLMLGQAALESGWGKRELKAMDGTPSHNLFGIKATSSWDGKVIEATTTEYINGIKQKRIEKFRAYDSYAESFKDFANLMRNNPRYENVIANMHDVKSYAQAMQKAGYATDPNYANKLASVIQKVSPS
jgi:flagellar protein FlgJ